VKGGHARLERECPSEDLERPGDVFEVDQVAAEEPAQAEREQSCTHQLLAGNAHADKPGLHEGEPAKEDSAQGVQMVLPGDAHSDQRLLAGDAEQLRRAFVDPRAKAPDENQLNVVVAVK